ncbi:MAG: hypothetical protein D6803_03960 [Anaerolineae bacterium]|nr:MAG: hypothetical protein D6803_03960 [Anaerolineae bacterium]
MKIPTPIPPTLAPFFQEYDLRRLDLQQGRGTIIERVLQFGNREEIRWLFGAYPRAEIRAWVEQWGDLALPEPHRTFWRLVLGLEDLQ